MDLETESRIAAILLKEAAEMRRQAQKEGALAYLQQPTVRSKPNSRFLTATVRGVQQANRAVEVNEMWRIREKQLELENRLHFRNKSSSRCSHDNVSEHRRHKSSGSNYVETSKNSSVSSKKRDIQDLDSVEDDEGLRDDEVDKFLRSRKKRGRGAVGSRMDEAGPYLPYPDSEMNMSEVSDAELNKAHVVLRPERSYSLRFSGLSDDESSQDEKKASKSSSKLHLRKRKSKYRDKKKKKEKRSKHHK